MILDKLLDNQFYQTTETVKLALTVNENGKCKWSTLVSPW